MFAQSFTLYMITNIISRSPSASSAAIGGLFGTCHLGGGRRHGQAKGAGGARLVGALVGLGGVRILGAGELLLPLHLRFR